MTASDLTVAILREIRDEIRTTNSKLDTTNGRIDAVGEELSARIDGAREELSARIDVTNSRLEVVETTLRDLAGQQVMLTRYMKNFVDRHDSLEERVTRVEARLDER